MYSFCFSSSCSKEIDVNSENLNMENVTASEVFKGDRLSSSISQLTNDPSLYTDIKITIILLQVLTSLGPLQPVTSDLPGAIFPKALFGGIKRSFSEVHYTRNSAGQSQDRKWLAYSIITDCVYC